MSPDGQVTICIMLLLIFRFWGRWNEHRCQLLRLISDLYPQLYIKYAKTILARQRRRDVYIYSVPNATCIFVYNMHYLQDNIIVSNICLLYSISQTTIKGGVRPPSIAIPIYRSHLSMATHNSASYDRWAGHPRCLLDWHSEILYKT